VLLTDKDHRSDTEVAHLYTFAGNHVFDIYRRPATNASKPRALFVDGFKLQQQRKFVDWLRNRLIQSTKAATQLIVFQDDPQSKALALTTKRYCERVLNFRKLPVIPSGDLATTQLDNSAGVIVCAAVVGKGSLLLEISRALRDMHSGPRLYLIGFQVSETREELRTLDSNLKHSKNVPYEVAKFGQAAIGTQLEAAFSAEVKRYYGSSTKLDGLPESMKKRALLLGTATACGQLALLPHGSSLKDSMKLRPGFAYWPNAFKAQPCHAEVLATVAILLQRAREYRDLPDERRLHAPSFRHVVLDPENFTRFNDGVLQAALLRCAYPSELDYRSDHAASDFMKAVILRALARADQETGEGTLEFLLAIAQRRLQLREEHSDEVIMTAQKAEGKSSMLRAAIKFILKADSSTAPTKLPF
jgi:hypothetical protein